MSETSPHSDQRWLLPQLSLRESRVGRWQSLTPELTAVLPAAPDLPNALPLTLYRDERSDYRFNLSSDAPRLFLVASGAGESLRADLLTLSQSVAAAYMDGDRTVLSCPLPEALQAWCEAFIGRHGELIERRGKGKKGKGRARETVGPDACPLRGDPLEGAQP